MKIKFNSDHELPLNKWYKFKCMKIVFRAAFHENNKYYPQVFLCMNNVKMLYFERTDVSKGTDASKTSNSRECGICQPYLCNRYHDLLIMSMNLSHIAILKIKNVVYCWIITGISKSEAMKLLQNIDLTKNSETSEISRAILML